MIKRRRRARNCFAERPRWIELNEVSIVRISFEGGGGAKRSSASARSAKQARFPLGMPSTASPLLSSRLLAPRARGSRGREVVRENKRKEKNMKKILKKKNKWKKREKQTIIPCEQEGNKRQPNKQNINFDAVHSSLQNIKELLFLFFHTDQNANWFHEEWNACRAPDSLGMSRGKRSFFLIATRFLLDCNCTYKEKC